MTDLHVVELGQARLELTLFMSEFYNLTALVFDFPGNLGDALFFAGSVLLKVVLVLQHVAGAHRLELARQAVRKFSVQSVVLHAERVDGARGVANGNDPGNLSDF